MECDPRVVSQNRFFFFFPGLLLVMLFIRTIETEDSSYPLMALRVKSKDRIVLQSSIKPTLAHLPLLCRLLSLSPRCPHCSLILKALCHVPLVRPILFFTAKPNSLSSVEHHILSAALRICKEAPAPPTGPIAVIQTSVPSPSVNLLQHPAHCTVLKAF